MFQLRSILINILPAENNFCSYKFLKSILREQTILNSLLLDYLSVWEQKGLLNQRHTFWSQDTWQYATMHCPPKNYFSLSHFESVSKFSAANHASRVDVVEMPAFPAHLGHLRRSLFVCRRQKSLSRYRGRQSCYRGRQQLRLNWAPFFCCVNIGHS